MVILKILFFNIFLMQPSLAFKLPMTSYKDGPSVCRELLKNKTGEIGKWVAIENDYTDKKSGKSLIYTYTQKIFNPQLPSLIYIVGGPGSSSHGAEFSLPNTNIIFFEQRGIGCSRPRTQELFLNPKFYSSENTAQDVLNIVNAYKIQKISVYGHSYGTVPATIFASKYPERIRMLLLEGVVFKADESLWISQRKIQILENFFYSLTQKQQERILSVSARPDIPNTWFSYIGKMAMSVGNFRDGLMGFLNETVFKVSDNQEAADRGFAKQMTAMVAKPDITTPAEQDNAFGGVTMGMIGCQEMGMSNPLMSHLLYFKNGHLVPDQNNVDLVSMCEPLGLASIRATYSAEKYPIQVPVIYFLGEYDSATSLDQGLNHFNFAKSTQKQALILKDGGHGPNLELLLTASYCNTEKNNCKQHQAEIEIFKNAVHGKTISPKEIQHFNSLGTLEWREFKNSELFD